MSKLNAENIFKFLGENKYGGVIVMCIIAIFKGTFRPIFTMMDKTSDPKTKKYAAIREGLTEVAAFPIYATVPILLEKIINKVYKGRENVEDLKANARFLGLAAATILIPAACNVIQPPIMKAYKKYEDAQKTKIGSKSLISTTRKPTFNNRFNSGMKVGG